MYQFILKVFTLIALATVLAACDSSSDRKEVGSTWVELDTFQATDPVISEPEVVDTADVTVTEDVSRDPCRAYRKLIQENTPYMCVGACGQGSCTPTLEDAGGTCGVRCMPNFNEFANRLEYLDNKSFIYKLPDLPDCAVTCTPVQ